MTDYKRLCERLAASLAAMTDEPWPGDEPIACSGCRHEGKHFCDEGMCFIAWRKAVIVLEDAREALKA